MKAEVFKCDGCKKIQGEANHWFTVAITTDDPRVTYMAFHSTMDGADHHYCSQECFVRMVLDNIPHEMT